jgi:DNA invertase Pin-like site-specific DNA recombinase
VCTAPSSIENLDQLASNFAFVSNLMASGVDFEAVDFPQANRLTIHILATVAEHEAKMISERTKAALAAAKRRGVQLGGLTAKARQAGWEARSSARRRTGCDLAPIVAELRTV